MIKLFGRMVPAVIRALAAPRLHPQQLHTSRFRVLPHDIDLNLHLNNGRYLQLIDLNRLEWLLRTGIAQAALRERWKAVLGSNAIQFRRELRLGETGVMSTRLLGWDERWFFLEHRVETVDGKPVALSLARAGLRRAGRWVQPAAVQAALGTALPDMRLPPHVEVWRQLDAQLGSGLSSAFPLLPAKK